MTTRIGFRTKFFFSLTYLATQCAAVGALTIYPLGWANATPAIPVSNPLYTCVTNTYVDSRTGSDSNPGTSSLPWKTIGRANSASPTAGTCINVASGTLASPATYSLTQSITVTHGGNTNTQSGFVVYRSVGPLHAHVIPTTSNVGDIFQLEVPYVIIDGFDIDGNKALTTGNGVNGCIGGGGPNFISHHFIAVNNIVHDLGGAGLASCTADYIVWERNHVYNTSSTSPFAVSGLDLGAPLQIVPTASSPPADHAVFGIVMAYNDVHDNGEGPSISGAHTDGNGIIVDTTNANSSGYVGYNGQILILGNVSYHNGGGGIHIFNSHNVTVANNTVYQNYQDLLNPGSPRGELSNGGSQNVHWYNNIAIAVPGSGVLAGAEPIVGFSVGSSQDTGGIFENNITFGAKNTLDYPSTLDSTNLVNVNPILANPAGGLFYPLAGSPAIQAGMPMSFIPSRKPDIGACSQAQIHC